MKTIIFSLCLVFWMGTLQAQKMIALETAEVNYISPEVVTSSNVKNLKFDVREEHFNHFINNPIKFVEENFDYKALNLGESDDAEVIFNCTKGYLKATFNENGDMVRTSQEYKDIRLPQSIWNQIYKENTGWSMVSNKYSARGKSNKIDKELYKIKLVKGKETKNIKYVPDSEDRVASK